MHMEDQSIIMNKIFIYYSLSGNGDVVADHLKKKSIDIRKVTTKDKMPKSFFFRIMMGGYYALREYKPQLVDFDSDISKYDEILLGTPIWNDRISPAILSVIDKLDLKDKKITFIFYSGSGKTNKGYEKVKNLFPKCDVINLKEPKVNKEELNKVP